MRNESGELERRRRELGAQWAGQWKTGFTPHLLLLLLLLALPFLLLPPPACFLPQFSPGLSVRLGHSSAATSN